MPTLTAQARARFAHKIDRRWQKGAPAPMPKFWRLVCDLALAANPRKASDEHFHRAVVASLRFSLPRAAGTEGASREMEVWARDPRNVADLAVDLYTVIRSHSMVSRAADGWCAGKA